MKQKLGCTLSIVLVIMFIVKMAITPTAVVWISCISDDQFYRQYTCSFDNTVWMSEKCKCLQAKISWKKQNQSYTMNTFIHNAPSTWEWQPLLISYQICWSYDKNRDPKNTFWSLNMDVILPIVWWSILCDQK